ncbi:MAG: hypothetical protein ACJASZ_002285 [Yoonia sp.]|jgi:hypothetical protein
MLRHSVLERHHWPSIGCRVCSNLNFVAKFNDASRMSHMKDMKPLREAIVLARPH